ncbi:MAG: hypothetical protein JWP27_3099 [Flaviaesturariibacter sp.]|nr:hypothetical protein [Flaviaesturariibacter sp.]
MVPATAQSPDRWAQLTKPSSTSMRQVPVLLLIVCITKVTHAQVAKKDTLISTSKVINQLSDYWKFDSLAVTGDRLFTYKQLLTSKLDQVSKDFLVEKLGKPNQLRNTTYGTEYVYYIFDIKALQKKIMTLRQHVGISHFILSPMKTSPQK